MASVLKVNEVQSDTSLPLVFNVGNAERVRIDTSGNVGIGTNSPLTYNSKLCVVDGDIVNINNSASWLVRKARSDNSNSMGLYDPTGFGVMAFYAAASEAMRIDSSGNVGIGTSSPTDGKLVITGSSVTTAQGIRLTADTADARFICESATLGAGILGTFSNHSQLFYTNSAERARIDASGNYFVGRTAISGFSNETGIWMSPTQGITVGKNSGANLGACLYLNRLGSLGDGNLIEFAESGIVEGSISISGTAVSYNGGHLSRWAQMLGAKDESLVKGTVMSNLDEMNVYTDAEGNPVDNEQLNKVKVSDVEGDVNVAGVFVNWTHDEAHDVDEINMAMTGDMIIRIAQGVTVQKGDLLMSAGDGTAKPQGDDIVRSKTVAKVTSSHVTCTYDDGSYCVPCVLMAC